MKALHPRHRLESLGSTLHSTGGNRLSAKPIGKQTAEGLFTSLSDSLRDFDISKGLSEGLFTSLSDSLRDLDISKGLFEGLLTFLRGFLRGS